ncbi:unnamed protein product, partial [Timema podura]|nr:unnamed protein product [Timema podura]
IKTSQVQEELINLQDWKSRVAHVLHKIENLYPKRKRLLESGLESSYLRINKLLSYKPTEKLLSGEVHLIRPEGALQEDHCELHKIKYLKESCFSFPPPTTESRDLFPDAFILSRCGAAEKVPGGTAIGRQGEVALAFIELNYTLVVWNIPADTVSSSMSVLRVRLDGSSAEFISVWTQKASQGGVIKGDPFPGEGCVKGGGAVGSDPDKYRRDLCRVDLDRLIKVLYHRRWDTRVNRRYRPRRRYFQGTVNIHLVDGDHRTLLSNRATADIINNEAMANISV